MLTGTANFCKNTATPTHAEEGLSSALPQPATGSIGCYGNQTTFSDDELKSLDAEGRTVITKHRIRLALLLKVRNTLLTSKNEKLKCILFNKTRKQSSNLLLLFKHFCFSIYDVTW